MSSRNEPTIREDVVYANDDERLVVEDRQRYAAADTVRERRWDVAPGQIVSLVAGLGFVAVGLVALLRSGFDGSLDTPVVQVLGFSHTGWLGIAEIAVGLLLMLAGADVAGKSLSVLLGAVLVIAGVIVISVPEDLPSDLGIEKSYGTPLIIVGAVVALAALLLPAWTSHRVDRQVVDTRR